MGRARKKYGDRIETRLLLGVLLSYVPWNLGFKFHRQGVKRSGLSVSENKGSVRYVAVVLASSLSEKRRKEAKESRAREQHASCLSAKVEWPRPRRQPRVRRLGSARPSPPQPNIPPKVRLTMAGPISDSATSNDGVAKKPTDYTGWSPVRGSGVRHSTATDRNKLGFGKTGYIPLLPPFPLPPPWQW